MIHTESPRVPQWPTNTNNKEQIRWQEVWMTSSLRYESPQLLTHLLVSLLVPNSYMDRLQYTHASTVD